MNQISETAFEPDWLALREPADHAARDAALLVRVARSLRAGATILDLGSGTGSTARAFAAAGFTDLNWRFFDIDSKLLQLAQVRHPRAECVVGNLADIDAIPFESVDLITASALFDLMPPTWIAALMARASAAGVPIYTALNYDGIMQWTPSDPRDADITRAFNAHQRTNKGLGPALGPTSAETCAHFADALGYKVTSAKSPWRIGPNTRALYDALILGIADAALAAGAQDADAWGKDRRATATFTTAMIGHTDILVTNT